MKPRNRTRPCGLCGLSVPIPIRGGALGRVCLFYGIRIAPDEINDPSAPLRRQCVVNGNHFTWPARGMSASELLAWRREHLDWAVGRRSLHVAIVTGIVTAAATLIGVFVAS